MTHYFNQDLAFSHSQEDAPWWRIVYRTAFPDLEAMVSVRKDGWAQRGGIDRVLMLKSGKTLTVDEKVRRKDYGDIALEYWSDEQRRKPGWVAQDLACDYIAYACATSGVCYLLPFQELRRAWRRWHGEWVRSYPRIPAQNPGYVTISVGVPADVVLSAITDGMVLSWRTDDG